MTYDTTSTIHASRHADLDSPRLYDGVRTRRILSFIIDYALVLLLSVPAAVLVFLLGILTFGFAWGLYAVLLPVIALLYVGFTMGGASQATPGMRLVGVHIARLDGGSVDPILAILHFVLFWASNSILTPFVLLVALFTPRKQLLQDLLLGTVVVRDRLPY